MAHNEIVNELNKAIREKYLNNKKAKDLGWELVEKEAELRSFLKNKLPGANIDNLKLSTGESVLSTLTKNHLLPDALKVSQRIRSSAIPFDLGKLSIIPTEILHYMIFKRLTIEEACSLVTVSRSWLKETTSDHIWSSGVESTSSAPYFALLKRKAYSSYLKRKTYCYCEDVDVTDGEGLLVPESRDVQGLKLNGKPILASWCDNAGSVGRCFTRSKVLTKEEISHITKSIDSFMNAPELDLSVLDEKLTPFLKCMQSGKYRISVQREYCISAFGYTTTSDLNHVEGNYADHMQVYCTQPEDLLDKRRVEYYVEQLKKGSRPAVLTIKTDSNACFLIDGHHKLKAYSCSQLLKEMIFVHVEPMDFPDISREEELKYVNHSPAALQSYHQATDFLYPN